MHQVTFKFQAGDLVCTATGKFGVVIYCIEEYGANAYQVETPYGRLPYSEEQLKTDTPVEHSITPAEAATDVQVDSGEEEATPVTLTDQQLVFMMAELGEQLRTLSGANECLDLGNEFIAKGLGADVVTMTVDGRIFQLQRGGGHQSN